MGSVFKSPSKPKLPPEPEPIAEITEDDASAAQRRKKKKIVTGGRSSTIISGITSALKRRLGE